MELHTFAECLERYTSKIVFGVLVIIMLLLSYLVIEVRKLNAIQKVAEHNQTSDDSMLRPPRDYFQAQENIINNEAHWPKTGEEIDALFSEIESKTAVLNVVQKMALGQDVERLEWSLNALRFLAAQDKPELDRDDWQDLLDRTPKGASVKLINAVKNAEPSSERVLTDAMAEAEKLLITVAVSADQLSETRNRLDSLSRAAPKNLNEKFSEVKKKLKSALVQAETREMCEEVGRQLSLLSQLDIPDNILATSSLLGKLIETRLRVVIKEGESEPALLTEMIGIVRGLAEKQQDASRQEYQRWALGNIREFEKINANGSHEKIETAFKDYLFPISEPHLERPVAILYNKMFDEGWAKLASDGKDKLAEAAAVTKKTLPKAGY